jgi:hypothetical protein
MADHFKTMYGSVPGGKDMIEDAVREWFEQQLIETVMGVRALKGSKLWGDDQIEAELSEEALTAAIMPRYHVYTAVKRALGVQLGSLKGRAVAEEEEPSGVAVAVA